MYTVYGTWGTSLSELQLGALFSPSSTSMDLRWRRRSLRLCLPAASPAPATPCASVSQNRTKSRSMWYPYGQHSHGGYLLLRLPLVPPQSSPDLCRVKPETNTVL